MTRIALFAIALSVPAFLVATPAFADPTAPAPGHVHYMQTLVVTGRAQRPAVVVVVTRPTAAQEAGAAHESLREALLAKTEPITH
jgi:hypothetical protein